MSLLNTTLLGWLAWISIPILVHLLTRRAKRRLDLPTMRFVQKSIARQSSIFKWRHLLVLLLRVLIVACIVLAFARPVMTGPLNLTAGSKKCVILIVDDSASMGYRSGSISTLDHARQDAISLLGGLHAGDRANVIVCDGHPHAMAGEPTIDVGALRSGVESLAASPQRADPTSAINLAVDQLSRAPDNIKSRGIYMLSDFQRSNWGDVRFDAVPSDVKLAFLPSADDSRVNAGITAIHLYPSSPRIGEPITVGCEVFNSSNSLRTLPVNLSLNSGYKTSQNVTVAPYSSANVSFDLQFDTPQTVECTATIPGDSLQIDDTRRAVIDLQQSATILLISDESVSDPASAVYYLSRALHPDANSNVGFHVVTVKPSALTPALMHSADAAIVCDASLGDSGNEQVEQYVAAGGNVVWMLSGAMAGQQLADFGKLLPPQNPIPFAVQNIEDLTGNGNGYVTLAEAHYDSPLLKAFKDPAAADLSSIHFRKIAITSEVDPRAEILMKYDDGTVAALRTAEGSGSLLILNMSPAPGWSDFARQDAFLPLMHEFIKGMLAHVENERQSFAGDSAATSIQGASGSIKLASLSCLGPDGDTHLSGDPSTGSVVIDQTTSPGFYQILKVDKTLVGDVAVNVSPDESDLRPIDPRELESSGQKERSVFASSTSHAASLRQDAPIWPYLLAAALVLLVSEQWLAGLAPRAKPTEPIR